MTNRVSLTSDKAPFLNWAAAHSNLLLVLSPLLGLLISVGPRLCWQDPIESAQVIAGLVAYPPDNPFYIMHTKGWSLLNQLSAGVLYLHGSDFTVNFLLAGLAGATSFAGVTLIVQAISRNPLVALATPLFMYSASLLGPSNGYAIAFLGLPATYGILGLSTMLLTIGLLGCGHARAGALLVGLAPAIHVTFGAYSLLVVATTVVLTYRHLRASTQKVVIFFLLGTGITVMSLGGQYYLAPSALPHLDSALMQSYLDAFINNYDYHRHAGRWSSPAVLLAIATAILAALAIRRANVSGGARLVLYSIAVSVPIALLIVLTANNVTPWYVLKISIPWRFINYSTVCLIPLCFSLLAADYLPAPRLRAGLLTTIMGTCFLWRIAQLPYENGTYFIVLVLLFLIVCLRLPDLPKATCAWFYRGQQFILVSLIIVLTMRQVVPDIFPRALSLQTARKELQHRSTTVIFRIASSRPGLLLTAGGMHQIQLVTQRPVVIDGGGLDMFPYIPETGKTFNNILTKIYGADLFVTPSEDDRNKGSLTFSHMSLWEKRSLEEWQNIQREFGVTDILTPASWHLNLPLVIREPDVDNKLAPFYQPSPVKETGMALYTIPR
jgi:hypothetical protein